MKRKILSLAVIFTMLLTLTPSAVQAKMIEKHDDYLFYEVSNDDTITITACDDSAVNVTIPSEIDGKKVTSIAANAFKECSSLESVTIPDSVTSIGNFAFMGCGKLSGITLPDSLTSIGEKAFGSTAYSLDESNWENDVLYIGNYLLSAKSSISGSYTIKQGTTCIADYAFMTYTGSYTELTSISIPNSVTHIGNFAFDSCSSITSITIPDSVISIGDEAFSGCYSLANITLPDSLTHIGKYAFVSTAYKKNTGNWENDVLYIGHHLIESKSNNVTGEYSIKNGTICIADWTFFGCKKITGIDIPDSVKYIGSFAFADCTELTSVTMSDNLISIGDSAFSGCSKLTGITIPDGVISIGGRAFSNCLKITNINIPASVISIGAGAFYYCKLLTDINVSEYNTAFVSDDGVLFDKDKTKIISYPMAKEDTSYIIPDGVTQIVDFAFNCAGSLKSVALPNNLKIIGNSAFVSCKNITSIEMPDSIQSIGENAFAFCTNLSSITIPDNIKSIGYNAFEKTSYVNISSNRRNGAIYIGNHLISTPAVVAQGEYEIEPGTKCIADYAFAYCYYLTSVKIPSSVRCINVNTFHACKALESISIPDSVEIAGQQAFYNCESLQDVYYSGTSRQWDAMSILQYNDELKNAKVHYNRTSPQPIPATEINVSKTETDTEWNFEVELGKQYDCTYVYAAIYDKDGILTNMDCVPVDMADKANLTVQKSAADKTASIFVWAEDIEAITEAYTLNL